MEDKEPVALWKGIVGTALSSTILFVLIPFDIIVPSFKSSELLWLSVALLTSTAVCLLSLIISTFNLISTINYKKSHTKPSVQKENSNDNAELLHRLLSEGKITIEEYDKLRNK